MREIILKLLKAERLTRALEMRFSMGKRAKQGREGGENLCKADSWEKEAL